MTLQELTAHYSAVRKRIALPPKPPIVIQATEERITSPIKVGRKPRTSTPRKSRQLEQQEEIKAMFLRGRSNRQIADALFFEQSTIRKFIKKMGWTR